MHETPKGADPMQQDRDHQHGMDRQQNQQGGGDQSAMKTGGGQAGQGTSGMQEGEASGAGYGNNAEQSGSEAERGR